MVWFEGVSDWVPLSRIPGLPMGLIHSVPRRPKPPPAPAAPAAPPPMKQPHRPSWRQNRSRIATRLADEEGPQLDDANDEPIASLTSGLASHGARILAGLVDGAIVFGVLAY